MPPASGRGQSHGLVISRASRGADCALQTQRMVTRPADWSRLQNWLRLAGEGAARRRCWREGNLALQTALSSLESSCLHSYTDSSSLFALGDLTTEQSLLFWGLQSGRELGSRSS